MEAWYAVRCVFRWVTHGAYEERITLWRADSTETAILLAEQEAAEYVEGQDFEFLDFAQSYRLSDAAIGQGTEVFSLLRDSDLPPDAYLDAFFDTGSERQEVLGG
ncbi:hypothetical protein AB0B45_45120 [Nonomuraea sp. NPDC049152]|uniref:hypothetical protein n=1 Tax=unclassified Nonomuraea TaxID=2593643 RepID=UPI0034091771